MQFLEPQPISLFIKKKLEFPKIKPIIDTWSIDQDELLDLLTSHFHDMGCYEANPETDQALTEYLINLNFSLKLS